MPRNSRFGPLDAKEDTDVIVNMTLDEYETIRLMDYEGMTQEECAKIMGVARTTVQSIYSSARKKLSELLVFGVRLRIEGGEVKISEEHERRCSIRMGKRRACCQRKDQPPCDCPKK